jgi:HAMP domain-containing protein
MNPRNPLNRADSFEQSVLQFFTEKRHISETKGFIDKGNAEFFYVAKAVVSEDSCMHCHSQPNVAPQEVVAIYGNTAAFGWSPNQVMASLIVYVPTKLAREHAIKALLTFMGLYAAVFFVILFMIDRAIVSGIIKPIKNFAATADEISKGKFDKDFSAAGNDEMKTLAEAFSRMKMSIIASMNMIEKYRSKDSK